MPFCSRALIIAVPIVPLPPVTIASSLLGFCILVDLGLCRWGRKRYVRRMDIADIIIMVMGYSEMVRRSHSL